MLVRGPNWPYFEPDSVVFGDRQIYWVTGVGSIVNQIVSGATCILSAKPFSAQSYLELIEKYKVNFINPTPVNLVSYLKYDGIHSLDLSSVRLIRTSGAKLSLHFIDDIKRYFPNARVVEGYGMTEIGTIATNTLINPHVNTYCEAGHRLRSNRLVKIVDDTGNRCGPHTIGEIRVKSAFVFGGYLNDPKQTANAVDDEGFFRTNDMGQFNDRGFLLIGDRIKDVFRVYYYIALISPHEIEECLLKICGIEEVCIVGIPIVASYCLPAAVVVRRPDSNLNQRDIFNVVAGSFICQ